MGRKSMEEVVLRLFFDYPAKHWHFVGIKKEVRISDHNLSRWLKKFMVEKLIKRIKPTGKMPYYVGDFQSTSYQNKKKLYGLKELYNSGLLNHMMSLKGARTVILFGSFARWDWHKDSDIDIFIYGEDEGFMQGKYEKILRRDIQLFSCRNQTELRKMSNDLLRSVIKGYIIKGDIDFVEVFADGKEHQRKGGI